MIDNTSDRSWQKVFLQILKWVTEPACLMSECLCSVNYELSNIWHFLPEHEQKHAGWYSWSPTPPAEKQWRKGCRSIHKEQHPGLWCLTPGLGSCSHCSRTVSLSSVQSLSHVWLFATPWTAAHQVSLAITNSRNLLKLMSIRLVMPSNHVILCCPLLLLPSIFPILASGSFQMSQFFASGSLSIGASALTSVLPTNIQDWFPLGLTGWISLQSRGLSRVFSNTRVQKHQFFSAQLSL